MPVPRLRSVEIRRLDFHSFAEIEHCGRAVSFESGPFGGKKQFIMMRVLFDMTHPAHVHLFKNVIWLLQKRGHRTLVAAREKDVAIDLLKALRIEHVCLSRRNRGPLGMAWELVERDARMISLVRRFRPHVLIGLAGVSVGIVGRLTGIPSLVLEEAEFAWLQRAIALPFVTRVFTGTGYLKDIGSRQAHFRGIWVQAYLDPRYFVPDPDPVRRAGVDPEKPYIVMRTVSYTAAHDIGRRRTSEEELCRVVRGLSRFGRVLISSETPLPESLADYQNPVPAQHIHDLLAHADLCIAQGGTMAAEAAVLGVPVVGCDTYNFGYLQALEKKYGLLRKADSLTEAMRMGEELLRTPGVRQILQARRQKLLEESEDIVEFIFRLIEETAGRAGAGRGRRT